MEDNMETKLSLLVHQKPMLKVLGQVFSNALLGGMKKKGEPFPFGQTMSMTVDAVSNDVVDSFVKWLDVKNRYENDIPSHFFPQWCIPLAFELGKNHPYPLHKVINQGCSLKVYGPVPRGQQFHLEGVFVEAKREENKSRLHQKVITKDLQGKTLLEADFHSVFIYSRGPKKKKEEFRLPENSQLVGEWSVVANDGKNYGIISGDLNPIHWSSAAAKLSGFPNKILHGFASFSKTFECLLDYGLNPKDIDVRFLSPVVLPAKVKVYIVASDNQYQLLVTNQNETKLHLKGEFKV